MRALLPLLLVLAAAPKPRTVLVPTKLQVERREKGTQLHVTFAGERERATVSVTPGLNLGVATREVVFPVGAPRPATMRSGLSSGTSFEGATSIHPADAGVPYEVEVEVELFETDVPPGRAWAPRSGKYGVLWTKRLTQRVE